WQRPSARQGKRQEAQGVGGRRPAGSSPEAVGLCPVLPGRRGESVSDVTHDRQRRSKATETDFRLIIFYNISRRHQCSLWLYLWVGVTSLCPVHPGRRGESVSDIDT
ncbi:unnamed protein product, partial [Laminaria digitata]